MWDRVTADYGGNSNVYFEPMNEPFGYSLSSWVSLQGPGVRGKVSRVLNGQSVDFDPVDLYSCNGTTAQSRSLESDRAIRGLGKCLDVNGSRLTSGASVDLYTCNNTGAQQWARSSNGTYAGSLTNPRSGLSLDDRVATTTVGTRLQTFTCNGTLA